MPDHPTEQFGDPATSWVVGRMPVGWRLTHKLIIEDPQSQVRVEIERRTGGTLLPGLVHAQDQLDSLLARTEPTPVVLAGLSAVPIRGVDGGGYVALLDLPGTADVQVRAWACRGRDRISVVSTVPRAEWDQRSAEITALLESLEIPR